MVGAVVVVLCCSVMAAMVVFQFVSIPREATREEKAEPFTRFACYYYLDRRARERSTEIVNGMQETKRFLCFR